MRKRLGALLIIVLALMGVSSFLICHPQSTTAIGSLATITKSKSTTTSGSGKKTSTYLGQVVVTPTLSGTSTSAPASTLLQPELAYVVTNTNDTGTGSLRQAIEDTNNHAGADTIVFNIPGAGVHTIQPASALPYITDDVTIDGYSQPGASANTAPTPQPFNGTIAIELRGDGAVPNGLRLSSGISTIRGLAIGGFHDNGIYVRSNNNVIEGNYIGTNAAGTMDIMSPVGVNTRDVDGVRIGGSLPAQRNVISGNRDMNVILERADHATITGNYVGIAANGGLLPNNAWYGIGSSSSKYGQIGSGNTADKNVIAANQVQAGYISAVDSIIAEGNRVQGNYINTNIDGQDQVGYASLYAGMGFGGNLQDTVFGGLASGEGNTVGGTASGSANVLSGNGSDGVQTVASGTVIQGNLIGTNPAGTTARANGAMGVHIPSGGANTTVGGTSSAARNIISGNNVGMYLASSSGATVRGNYIGTDINGTGDLGNVDAGVTVEDANSNTIGGTDTGARNIISGNGTDGVDLVGSSTSNVVLGNYIGTDVNGTTAMGNDSKGVLLGGTAASNTIGGTADGSGNVISNNADSGVTLDGTGNNNTIAGNYIGVDATGLVDMGNGASGIAVSATGTGNVIGGTTASARNIVSGNAWSGVTLSGQNTTLQGNYIGLDKNGTAIIANTGGTTNANVGVTGSNNTIGGTASGAGNVISGSSNVPGISVTGLTPFGGSQVTGTKIQGNYIGTDASGNVQTGFGNTYGVQLALDTVDSLVGGTTSGAGNTIAGNNAGVVMVTFTGGTPVLNGSVLGNSIHDNTGGSVTSLGIDLMQTANFSTFVNAGVTANDAGDIDFGGTNTGTNHYLNFPVINSVSSSNGTATINYDLDINDSESGATGYRVEFFANTSPDPSGNGEGETYLGSDTVSGDVTGRSATITLPSGVSGAKYIVATTTMTDASADGFGHSSEFSANTAATLVAATSSNGGGAGAGSDLANTGQNAWMLWIAAAALLCTGSLAGVKVLRRKHSSISGQ